MIRKVTQLNKSKSIINSIPRWKMKKARPRIDIIVVSVYINYKIIETDNISALLQSHSHVMIFYKKAIYKIS